MSSASSPLLDFRDVSRSFTVRQGVLGRVRGEVRAVDFRTSRRDARPGGRVRVRQVDTGAHGCAASSSDGRGNPFRRRIRIARRVGPQ